MKIDSATKSILGAIVIALVAVTSGCKSSDETPKPINLVCPSGSKLVGDLPPDGEEQACWKTVNGEQVKDGPMVIYRPSGLKMMEGNYKDGKQDGEWRMYYESGAKKSIDHYQGWRPDRRSHLVVRGRPDRRDGDNTRMGSRTACGSDGRPDGVKNWEETYKDGKKIS